MDSEAEDESADNQLTAADGNSNGDNCVKRKRIDGSPVKVDLTNFIGPSVSDPGRQNRFAMLADLEIETNIADKNVTNNTVKGDTTTAKKTKGSATNPFCPPIFLYNVNIKRLVVDLEAITPKITFKIKNVNQHKSKLYLSDPNIHTEMMLRLREKNINSYSFTPKELKQVSLVLRGLYHRTDTDDIERALKEIIPNTISKVSKFTTSFSKKNSVDTGLFLISLLPGKKLSDVAHIKYLLSQTIIWEKPKKKDQEIQCHRCQHWGHISRNCNAEFKCVKCNNKHLPGECLRKKTEESDPSCVNCGESGHPANWRGCPAYKKYQSSRKERIKKAHEEKLFVRNNVRNVIPTSFVSPGRSFANLFSTQQNHQTNDRREKPPVIQEFLKLANFFLNQEELSLEEEINKFLDEYRNMPKNEAKAKFLSLLNKVKSTYGP